MADTRKPTLPEGVTMIELPDLREMVIHGRRRTQRTNMKTYKLSKDGNEIGRVFQKLMTFEQRTPGKRYVNYRWHNVRWSYRLEGRIGPMDRTGYETRQMAINFLFTRFQQIAEADARTDANTTLA